MTVLPGPGRWKYIACQDVGLMFLLWRPRPGATFWGRRSSPGVKTNGRKSARAIGSLRARDSLHDGSASAQRTGGASSLAASLASRHAHASLRAHPRTLTLFRRPPSERMPSAKKRNEVENLDSNIIDPDKRSRRSSNPPPPSKPSRDEDDEDNEDRCAQPLPACSARAAHLAAPPASQRRGGAGERRGGWQRRGTRRGDAGTAQLRQESQAQDHPGLFQGCRSQPAYPPQPAQPQNPAPPPLTPTSTTAATGSESDRPDLTPALNLTPT